MSTRQNPNHITTLKASQTDRAFILRIVLSLCVRLGLGFGRVLYRRAYSVGRSDTVLLIRSGAGALLLRIRRNLITRMSLLRRWRIVFLFPLLGNPDGLGEGQNGFSWCAITLTLSIEVKRSERLVCEERERTCLKAWYLLSRIVMIVITLGKSMTKSNRSLSGL